MRHYTTNENHGEDILKAIAKIEALENNFKYSQKEADEFAIGFAEWLAKWGNISLENGNWIINLRFKASTTKEALEIYKKEKGL